MDKKHSKAFSKLLRKTVNTLTALLDTVLRHISLRFEQISHRLHGNVLIPYKSKQMRKRYQSRLNGSTEIHFKNHAK